MADLLKFDGPADALVWKLHKEDITLGTKLVVNDSQEAIFYSGGQALDVFKTGTHTLGENNLPMLKKILNFFTGKNAMFGSEIYFVSKTSRLDFKWGTKTPFLVTDPEYNVLISVGCFGQFGLRITDSRLFVTQICGSMPELGNELVLEYFRGVILTRVKDTVAKALVDMNISVGKITAYIDDISRATHERLKDEFTKYGIELLGFYISSIAVPTEELERLRKGSFDRLEMEQFGSENYKLKRSFDLMEIAAENPAPANLLGAGNESGVGDQMAGLMAQIAGSKIPGLPEPPVVAGSAELPGEPATQNRLPTGTSPRLACQKCQNPLSVDSQFCNKCGQAVPTDPLCKSCDVKLDIDAAFCTKCGAKVETPSCISCGSELSEGMGFCSKCGTPATESDYETNQAASESDEL